MADFSSICRIRIAPLPSSRPADGLTGPESHKAKSVSFLTVRRSKLWIVVDKCAPHAPGGDQSGGASVKPENSKAGVTVQLSSVQPPSGSAACAALVCAARMDKTERKATVTPPGGDLVIEWRDDDKIVMTGPAEWEFSGHLDAETGAWSRDENAPSQEAI